MARSLSFPRSLRALFLPAYVLLGALPAGLTLGCGSSSNPGGPATGPIPGESTQVTVVVSSAANDQLARFGLQLETLALTDKQGKSTTLLSTPQEVEFVHLNGGAEPLLTVSVPQDVYTTATATVGYASFTCATEQSGDADISTYAYGAVPNNQVTVQLPEPLTVDGSTMALSLELLVSQSASFPSTCYEQGAPYSITPTFNLAAMTLSSQPTSVTNGKLTALEGLVASAGSTPGTFTVTAADTAIVIGGVQPPVATWNVSTNSSTVFQGIGNTDGLAAGMPVDLDGALQPDGSVLATRVAVPDPDATDLTVNIGLLREVDSSDPLLNQVAQEEEGPVQYEIIGWPEYNDSNTAFAIWGGLANLASLPFPASFSSANMVAGQMVLITTHATAVENYPTLVPATTTTLMPQTIDGTVQGMGTAGGFTTYTVQLAPYDFFPTFAVQGGQTTLLTNPQQVVVYADSNAQINTTATPGVGSLLRFSGVIFNDNGTLRMDCFAVADGVGVA